MITNFPTHDNTFNNNFTNYYTYDDNICRSPTDHFNLTPPNWFNELHQFAPTFADFSPKHEITFFERGEELGAGSLGTITKSNSPKITKNCFQSLADSGFEYVPKGEKNGQFSNACLLDDKEKRRGIRYKLLQVSQHIMPKNHRVNSCLRYRINKDENVKILQHNEHGCLHYGNLMRCGSVWLCPVCGAKISEVRRLELQKAKDNWLANGGFIYMLTLTTPHYSFTDLGGLLAGQAHALKLFWGGKEGEKLKKDLGLAGSVRAFEITYSDKNGFHPHYHILLFSKVDLSNDKIYKKFGGRLARRWQNSCVGAGLPKPSLENGCQLQDGSKAVEYITKFGEDGNFVEEKQWVDEKGHWNTSHEMTKSHLKTGKATSLTPFDFLRLYNDNPQKYGDLFRIYASAVRGKAQLYWSRGLKKLLGVADKTDEHIADNGAVSELDGDNTDLSIINETDKNSQVVAEIGELRWGLVRKYRKQHEILTICQFDLSNNTNLLEDYLYNLVLHETAILEKQLAKISAIPPKPKIQKTVIPHKFVANELFNPYPKFSPSWESWERKFGNVDLI